jgi:hypothetical protein
VWLTVALQEPINEDDLYFNVLVGADGERSCLADEFAFERKLFKGITNGPVIACLEGTGIERLTRCCV